MRAWISIFTVSLFFLWSSPVHAWMCEVGDEELAQVTGEGFSDFSVTGNIMRATFDISVETNMDIENLQMGYYPRSGYTRDWDQDWGNVNLGGSVLYGDLRCEGLFIEAGFSNLSDPANRSLDYIKVGTPSMTGPIRANFRSFSGQIEDDVYGVRLRLNSGLPYTVVSTGGEFSVTLSRTAGANRESGWWVHWESAYRTILF